MINKNFINWIVLFFVIIALIIFDLLFFNRLNQKKDASSFQKDIFQTLFYFSAGFLFSVVIYFTMGFKSSSEYLSCFLIEKSLSVDNLFFFKIIFNNFKFEKDIKRKILFYGIIGVVFFRGFFIYVGSDLIESFSWVLNVFAVTLIYLGCRTFWSKKDEQKQEKKIIFKMFHKINPVCWDQSYGNSFFIKNPKSYFKYSITPVFVCLLLVELSDVIFAIDSIPASFTVTNDGFVIFASNLFAILGLRALYFCLDRFLYAFKYMEKTISFILIFIGSKSLVHLFFPYIKINHFYSLLVIFIILSFGILLSVMKSQHK